MESISSQPTSPSPSEAEETTGTEVSPVHLDHDDAVLDDRPRLLMYMRALLTGSVIALITAVILFFAWNSGIKGVGRIAVAQTWRRCLLIVPIWLVSMIHWIDLSDYQITDNTRKFLTRVITGLKFLPLVGVAVCTVYACLPVLQLWRKTSSTFGVRLGELLAFAMGIAACGLIVMAHIGLRAVRSIDIPAVEPYDEPSPEDLDLWFGHTRDAGLLQGARRALQGHPFRRLSTAALALLPAIALVAGFGVPYRALKSTYVDTATVTQTTASAVDDAQLPAYPSSF